MLNVIFKSLNCPKMFHVNRDSSSLVRKMVVVVTCNNNEASTVLYFSGFGYGGMTIKMRTFYF
jgi:hypothetical protein